MVTSPKTQNILVPSCCHKQKRNLLLQNHHLSTGYHCKHKNIQSYYTVYTTGTLYFYLQEKKSVRQSSNERKKEDMRASQGDLKFQPVRSIFHPTNFFPLTISF